MNVVLAGGGHGHILILKELIKKPIKGVTITLITDNKYQYYSGMLTGFIEGIYSHDEITFDVEKLCKEANVKFLNEEIIEINSDTKTLVTKSNTIKYDILSMNLGSMSNDKFELQNENQSYTKPIGKVVSFYNYLLNENLNNKKLIIVGGGASGCELAISFKIKFKNLKVTILQRSKSLIPSYNSKSKKKLNERLNELGIEVITNIEVNDIEENKVKTNLMDIEYDYLIVSNGYRGTKIKFKGFNKDINNFIEVNSYLSHKENVFAMGDMIYFKNHPLPKAGVFAIRQAPILKNNLLYTINKYLDSTEYRNNKLELQEYIPQKKYLQILNTGNKTALLNYDGFSIKNKLSFSFKDYIDRDYMGKK